MKRLAKVISTAGHDGAIVELEDVSACSRCRRGQGCGAGLSAAFATSARPQLQCRSNVVSELHLSIGQSVVIDIDEEGSQWLWLAFASYGLPLAGMLLGAFSATLLMQPGAWVSDTIMPIRQELPVLLAALAGFGGGVFAWRVYAPRAVIRAQRSVCLHSARIVGLNPSSLSDS